MVPMGEDVDTFDVQFHDYDHSCFSYGQTHEVFVEGLRNPCFESCILSPNTQYMFRVRCVNKHGAGVWSDHYWLSTDGLGDDTAEV
ncbi:hypothetical protein J4Q44_G00268380 [Coregonus suidteri]|uniref:Fibronectin type-III domain-containing protein n=1 Tax=Coregonus suidteri TaxID=861788 RepID=A0AAN8L2M5_9TELE